MTASQAARLRNIFRSSSISRAASTRSKKVEFTQWAYFVEEVALIWGDGRLAALVAGLLFRPSYWAACWSVVLPVQIISRSLFRRSWVLVLQVFEGSVRLQRA
jgi:hypothetical protein